MDSALNITIRVSGRQAQAQLKAISKELEGVQKMVGKQIAAPTYNNHVGASSKWSPAIAAAQAKAAERAVTQATKAAEKERLRIATEASKSHNELMRKQTAFRQQQWRKQVAEARQAARDEENAKIKAFKEEEAAARAHQKKMDALGKGGPVSFAKNLASNTLVNAGKNIAWVGRQLTYNFTLPLVGAATVLFKFNQDVARSQTNLTKLYGQIGEDQNMLKQETDALSKSFELLSTRFGINQVDVIDIASAWAAAGAEGVGLANATRATIETMILGDMDAQKATEALIAIQSQWHFSTIENADGVSELTVQLANMNAIENATAISTQGIIEVIQRAGGVARTSGMSFRELAAFAAALVPATGDAEQAGTAMRSIISSLVAPTAQATEALKLMGITVTDKSWMGADATDKLHIMAEHFDKLSDAQKGVISSTVATRWQVSRFDVLMRDILDPLGAYNTALEVTKDQTTALEIRKRELNTVLSSSPKAWDIMTNAIRNSMAKAFIPMIPAIMSLVKFISQLALAFENMNPEWQKWILLGLAAIAVLGPLMTVVGSTMQLIGTFGTGLTTMAKGIWWFIQKALFPLIEALAEVAVAFIETAATEVAAFVAANWEIFAVVAAIAAVVGLVVLILKTDIEDPLVNLVKTIGEWLGKLPAMIGRALVGMIPIVANIINGLLQFLHRALGDRIWEIVTSIAKAFWALPKAIADALRAVFRVIKAAMEGIVDALSYLNPFARHSPSLVENVTRGISTILDQYARLRGIPSLVVDAAGALQNFGRATDAQGRSFREADLQKKADATTTANPAAQGAANALVQQIMRLEAALPALEAEIAAQERAVQDWTDALKAADAQIDQMQTHLDVLQKQYSDMGDTIDAANKRIGELAQTPIEGMTALGDAIFENELAQNKLNMELLQFEKQGMTLDSIKDKYAAMAGEIETLQGTQAELRTAGAGSDILGWYDQQIQGIQDQKKEMGGVEKQIVDINKQLDALDLEGRFLELTKAINFDPLERQIDKIANKITEMPFDEIVRQILEQQAIVDNLTPKYDQLGKEVEQEKDAIDAAKTARDGIAAQLDVEQDKLSALKDAYSDIKGLISDMEGALNDFASAATKAADDASRLEELFAAGAGLDFPDQGGTGGLGREGGLADIEKFNEDLQAEIDQAMADMGTFDLFGTLVDSLKNGWKKVTDFFSGIGNWIREHVWAILVGAFWFVGGAAIALYWGIYKVVTVWGPKVIGWINDYVIQPIWQALQDGWKLIVDVWNWLWENLIGPIIDFGTKVWETIVSVLTPVFETLSAIASTVWGVISTVISTAWGIIKPIWDAIYAFIDGYIVPIFQLFQVTVEIVVKIVVLSLLWLWTHVDEIFSFIWTVITNVVVPVFLWLKDKAVEAFDLLVSGMQWAWDNILSPMFDAIKWAVEHVVQPVFQWLKDEIGKIWDEISGDAKWWWDNVFQPIFTEISDDIGWWFDNVMAPLWDGFMWAFDHVIKPAFEHLRDDIIKPIMNAIHNVIATVWNAIATVIEGGVNFFIKAFNMIASAVNAVAGFLDIDARVSTMDEIKLPRIDTGDVTFPGGMDPVAPGVFAAGGVLPTADPSGGVYAGARAIVGEGSNFYPEFVIPTDPAYRNRAMALLNQAGTRLLAGGGVVGETLEDQATNWNGRTGPAIGPIAGGTVHGSGGWIGGVMDHLASIGRTIEQGAIKAVWSGPKALADRAIDLIPNSTFKQAGHGILNALDSWITGRDTEWNALTSAYAPPPSAGGTGNTGSGATAAGIPITHGSGSWQAFVTLLNQQGIPFQNLGTYANRGTKYGTPSMHAQNRAMDFGGSQAQLQAIDHALYDAFHDQLYELIWSGPDARTVYKGLDHTFRQEILNDHRTHVHASMAQGGSFYVPRTPGGVNLNIAEGRTGEKVQILPIDGNEGGGTTIVINGNLEFPGIRNGSDAKDFIDNLKALAS